MTPQQREIAHVSLTEAAHRYREPGEVLADAFARLLDQRPDVVEALRANGVDEARVDTIVEELRPLRLKSVAQVGRVLHRHHRMRSNNPGDVRVMKQVCQRLLGVELRGPRAKRNLTS